MWMSTTKEEPLRSITKELLGKRNNDIRYLIKNKTTFNADVNDIVFSKVNLYWGGCNNAAIYGTRWMIAEKCY